MEAPGWTLRLDRITSGQLMAWFAVDDIRQREATSTGPLVGGRGLGHWLAGTESRWMGMPWSTV